MRTPLPLRIAVGIMLSSGVAATPHAQPPAAAPPAAKPVAPLSRFVPDDGLIAYIEFEGLDAHAASWKKTAAAAMLNDTPLGTLLTGLIAQGVDQVPKRVQQPPSGIQVTESALAALHKGFVLAVNKGTPENRVILAFRDGAGPELRPLTDLIFQMYNATLGRPSRPIKKDKRTVTAPFVARNGALVMWDEGGDRVFCSSKWLDQELDLIDGKKGTTLATKPSPDLEALRKGQAGFEPIGLALFDFAAIGPMSEEAVKQGFDGVKRVDFRVGFDGDAIKTVARVIAPRPRRGLLTLMDQPGFGLKSLPPLPAGLTGFTALSVDLGKVYDGIVTSMKADGPEGVNEAERVEAAARQTFKADLRRDVLAHLGPKIVAYAPPMVGGGAGLAPTITDTRLAIETDDPAAIGKALAGLMDVVNAGLNRGAAQPGGEAPGFKKADGPDVLYSMKLSPELGLPAALSGLEPTVMVGKDRLVIAASPAAAKAAAVVGHDGKPTWTPAGAWAKATASLPGSMIMLNVNDPRETFPPLIAGLPFLLEALNKANEQASRAQNGPNTIATKIPFEVDPTKVPAAEDLTKRMFPGTFTVTVNDEGLTVETRDAFPNVASPSAGAVAVALLLPAVQASREAARRVQCVNNLKQIGLAMHNYHSANNAFPKAAITDKDGKPLLSWRVAILPYIEQAELYKKFKLDEPWDSPNNKPLLDEMPAVFGCATAPKGGDKGGTHYRVFSGNGALFDAKGPVGLADVTDGSSNTIMAVETRDTVPWTKPEDLEFDPKKPAPFGAGSFHPRGYNVLFADGAVRFLALTVNPNVLRALITRAGGEVISNDAF